MTAHEKKKPIEMFLSILRVSPWLAPCLIAALAGASITSAATITVDTTDPAINADGSCSLIEAIINANDDASTHSDCVTGSGADTIELAAAATYTLNERYSAANGGIGLPILTSGIVINGHGSTLERDSGAVDLFRILQVGPTGNLTLNDLTTQNGFVDGFRGGGLRLQLGSLALVNVTVRNNEVVNQGCGGIVNNEGTLTVIDSTIGGPVTEDGNVSTGGGGGLCSLAINGDATTTLTDSDLMNNAAVIGGDALLTSVQTGRTGSVTLNSTTVSDHSATSAIWHTYRIGATNATNTLALNDSTVTGNGPSSSSAIEAYGIIADNVDVTLTLNQSEMSGNSTTGRGTLHAIECQISVVDSTIYDNTAALSGGGLYTEASQVSVVDSTIRNNTTNGYGGGIYVGPGSLDLIRSTVSGNASLGGAAFPLGGGLALASATATIQNSTISGNHALATTGSPSEHFGEGGGIGIGGFTEETTLTIEDSTIAGNTAFVGGAGISAWDSGFPAEVRLANSIIDGNELVIEGVDGSFPENCLTDGLATIISDDYNLSSDFSCGLMESNDLENQTAMLATLGDNGGPTQTHALLADSPALDSGPDAPMCPDVDQRGSSRPSADGCDRGAFEGDLLFSDGFENGDTTGWSNTEP